LIPQDSTRIYAGYLRWLTSFQFQVALANLLEYFDLEPRGEEANILIAEFQMEVSSFENYLPLI
jgi:hypothetical protein